jgi:hypothetical protein
MHRLKTLFIAANPSSTSRLALDEELRAILENLRAAEYRDAFEMVVAPAARADDLEQALLQHRPTIVHFSGHGAGVRGLVFQGDAPGTVKLLNAGAIGDLFRLLKKNVRIVILNACYSSEQAEAIAKEIDFVIGMKDTIGDIAARRFAASFYRGIAFGETVRSAFQLGVNALKRSELIADESAPELRVKEGISADARLLPINDSKGFAAFSSPLVQSTLLGIKLFRSTLSRSFGDAVHAEADYRIVLHSARETASHLCLQRTITLLNDIRLCYNTGPDEAALNVVMSEVRDLHGVETGGAVFIGFGLASVATLSAIASAKQQGSPKRRELFDRLLHMLITLSVWANQQKDGPLQQVPSHVSRWRSLMESSDANLGQLSKECLEFVTRFFVEHTPGLVIDAGQRIFSPEYLVIEWPSTFDMQ